ncbi:E3 SUMO-protein ligase RanBP2-like isoform X2 [Hyposmocoma kahamanoa]|uniref:E3 SUMO-protein ligase RanBP2-like isoform X2 n=1 Tax=Hyposmocoma kahamanoa TaxID=1477025 RepID=UPI000E6D6ED1|nr:E3 SUMO-protein ligase RanBP2-like isoform X2 [Hyposmocoma kahamanoa]
MYRTKKDVDKHVENLIAKLSVKEFKTRAYSIGRLYYEVGDYSSCQKYVEQYLTQKDNNAAAHKLLGQALQKLGQKEKALEHYKISLDIDPTQTSTILDICELLADDEVDIDPGRAKYWCEKAEATFPRHPITFRLRERLVTVSNPDPEALVKLLTAELAVRPKDAILHCRLLKHYQHTNQIKQAFEHSFNTEFGWKRNHFNNNYMWYDTLVEILKHNSHNPNDWQYQLLLLTVRERICVLSLTETPSGSAKSLIESNDLLHAYDQALEQVAKAEAPPGFGEFHAALLQHHRGQFVLHTATYLLKKAKKDQLSWRDAIWSAAPLMLIAWQTVPLDSKVNWLTHAPEKRLFDYTHKELSLKELNSLIEESKLYVAISHLNDGDYEKVIELLSSLKSPQAYYHLAYTYSKIAMEEKNLSRDHNAIDTKTKYATLMINAKSYAYKALDRVKETEINKDHPLYSQIQQLIEDVETNINKIDPELSINNDGDGKYSSDENISSGGSEHVQIRNNYQIFRNISSTPKQQSNSNLTQYRTAVDSQILQEPPRADSQFLEKIENQIKNFQMRLADDLMEQTKTWFEENRRLGNQIMNTIQSDIQNTTDQFKLLKVSVDHIKDQINECRNECKDVGDLRKQIAELKKEVNKLKKASTEQTIDDNDLYNLDEDYRTSENASTFATQLPFQTSQVMPPFNQRLVPPFPVPSNPYQLYNQSLYNLYNQYSQFGQTSGAPPLFDPTRTPINYPGVYPNPDQMYLDVAHLVPPSVPAVPTVPTVTPVPTVPPVPTMSSAATAPVNAPPPIATVAKPKPSSAVEPKDIPRSLPVNVVITSSDPLPTCTTAPPPILSVTIPPKHIKANATPHNYQIPMPSGNDTTVMSPPVFSFPGVGNKPVSTPSTLINWGQPSVFKTTQANNNTSATGNDSFLDLKNDTHSKSFVDGSFTGISPNTSFNKSRTLSERSNTSVENYDPCPDFKPIIPLPAEVKVTTGEEDETVIFSSRAKLFRFVDKQWKERGIGEIKLLKHKITGKVRVLMRREQIHKICANHVITPDMEIKPMKNETKAYFWVANDFADETVVLEKFCIRFKTADIAQQFSDIFEKSRLDSKNLLEGTNQSAATTTAMQNPLETERTPIAESKSEQSSTPVKPVFGFSYGTPQNKTEFGGFTFNSIPTFKTVPDNPKSDSKTDVPTTTKVNVFSNLNIAKPNTSSPFSNIFSTTTGPVVFSNSQTPKQETPNKLNASDTVEEFEPNVDFKPVVPLPALIDQKTGEEDETVLFEHRAKLLRFDANSKEWKERGLGNIKILAHKDNPQKVRLLMRREQIMKVCCNHAVTNDLVFQKMPNMDKAVTWCAKDFSEGELVAETFCLRFKTVQACDDFMDTLKSVQSKMKDDSKAAKEEQNEANLNNKVGFGDKFKPKAGSWYCETCYTNNLESFAKCACCEQPNPQSNVKEATTNEPTVAAAAWGDKFKPKVGSWECNGCFIRNEANIDHCPACHTPKEPGMPKIDSSVGAPSENTFKFKFGIPSQTTASAAPVAPLTSLGFGPKFNFGTPLTANNATEQTSKVETTSIFDGTGAHKFSFGIPTATSEQRSSVFGPKVSPAYETLINVPATPSHDKNQPIATVKPALLPTPQADTEAFGVKDAGTFDFKFKPKTPPKGKSPMKSPKSQGDESDEYASEDEGHHIYFSPVVPMPDKVEVVTGEENEIELYGHRAKLFRFIAGEWKERGIGIVKILKHKDTGKLRIVMRREQVLKICLNHALTPEILYSPKDDKTWLFAANDFSEGELSLQQFCLRFKTKEIALEFKEAIDNARDGKLAVKNESHSTKVNDSEDVVFVSEILATDDEKQKAKELMLPENFFTYKTKEPCQGCRGCMIDDEKSIHSTSSFSLTSRTTPFTSSLSTPVKSLPTAFQSPINSFYGTPANFDKTSDTSIFRTPLGSIGSNANSVSPVTPTNAAPANDTKNKENAFTQKNIFAGFGDKQNIFGQSQNTSSNIFGASESQITNAKSSILAPPKLGTQTSQFDNKPEETKSIFGTSQPKVVFGTTQSKPEETKPVFFGTSQSKTEENKSVFDTPQLGGESKSIFGNNNSGVSINESIFSFSSDNKKDDAQEPEVKSLFGGDSKPVNLFSSGYRGSLFGPGALSENQQKPNKVIFGSSAESIFGSNSAQPQNFGSGASVFNIAATGTQAPTWTFGGATNQQKPDMMKTPITATTENKTEETVESAAPETPFKVDNSLSFAALSSSGSGFNVQKNTDFQWEGAGQQLFTSAQKSAKDTDKSANESGAGDDSVAGAEEEYDPHYEPIVPLPDKIVVTTGEEDEVKLFGERCKLYRYDDKTREWKERGVGEMKVLYHPERKTYRFLLRREQVHKAVLNMLLFMDLELLPMKNSDRAWTWAGRNFAENPSGEQETLAVLFKSVELATNFRDKVNECIRKLQAAAAEAIREDVEKPVEPLRLPKGLQDSARADPAMSTKVTEVTDSQSKDQTDGKQNGQMKTELFKQVQFQEPQEDPDEEVYDHEYDYDYYNDEDEESATYYACDGEVLVRQGNSETACENAHVQLLFDQEIYSPKILVTDNDTGEILADMLIHTETEFQLNETSCTWSGTDYTSNDPVDKTVTMDFHDLETALTFYDSCETSKGATYSSTDPES